MKYSISDFITESISIKNYRCLDLLLMKTIGEFGFTRFGYVAKSLGRTTYNNPVVVRHTYPNAWVEYYMQNEYYLIDPVVIRGENETIPFEWGGKKFLKSLTKNQAEIFYEAEDYFIHNGYTVPIHGKGNESATLTVLCEENQNYFSHQINQHRHDIHILAHFYHQKVKEIYFSKKENLSHLTNREIECLTWASQGKTFSDIASILSISRNTVIFHIQNAKQKLDVKTINHAITKAIQASLIKF